MIVWVASFPRSGNTFLRIVLKQLYGLRTSVVYDVDGVAERLGADLVGFVERVAPIEAMRDSDEFHFVKTHRQRDDQVQEADRAICLVRAVATRSSRGPACSLRPTRAGSSRNYRH